MITKSAALTFNNRNSKKSLTLDIGAGENPKGDINVDIRRLSGIDVVCHSSYLPFKKDCFGHVYLSHVIEHLTYNEAYQLLYEANRVLNKEGIIEIWVPNFQSIAVLFSWLYDKPKRVKCGVPMILPMLSGDQDYTENVHKSLWTVRLLKMYLSACNFHVVSLEGESKISLLRKFLPSRCVVIHVTAKKFNEN